MEFIKNVIKSFTSEKNKGITGITTLGGIYCGLHITGLSVADFLTWEIVWKIGGSICTLIVAPPLGVFMTDVYKEKIKPRIKFLNKKPPTNESK